MIITRKEQQEVEVVDDVLCNNCGKSCSSFVAGVHEAAELVAHLGYGSLKDTERHQSHLCEECYDGIVATFKIPPAVSGALVYERP